MNLNSFLLIALCTALLAVLFFITKLRRVRGQLSIIEEALEDIKSGNPNRRVLARKSDMTKRICYAINEIAVKNQSQLIQQKQSEQAYKRLMTSLSHDVKTPLASLFGYLDAATNGLVAGEEKEAYIHVAVEKACHLKHFVEALFEWVKLDAKEQVFHFELCDFNVLTLILNNLFQNVLMHSGGNKLTLKLLENEQQVEIIISDNGKGISSSDIPHIFERMYQCDSSRSARGNGLGLSITTELVNAHNGKIKADSNPGMGATFTILFPKAL